MFGNHWHGLPRNLTAFGLIAVFLMFGSIDSRANELDDARAKIEAAGGSVSPIAEEYEGYQVSFALANQDVSDDALTALTDVPRLEWLYLQGTQITDAGLDTIAKLSDLTKLHLERTEIGDSGLAKLSGLEKLEYLNLYDTQVTDASVDTLASMKSLRRVYLWQSQVTDEGIKRLQEALPESLVMGAAEPLTVPNPLAEGRYIRVRLTGDNRILSLAEVQVFSADGEELQSSGTATQSSTDFEGAAERAIDGNTDAQYSAKTITHTKQESYPWWLLDLGEKKSIERVKVWNRADGVADRLTGAVVEILDEDRQVRWHAVIENTEEGAVAEWEAE